MGIDVEKKESLKEDSKKKDLNTPQDVLLLVQKIRIYSYSTKKISKLLKRLLVIFHRYNYLEYRKYNRFENVRPEMRDINLNFSFRTLLQR
jgi:hypothetical protein